MILVYLIPPSIAALCLTLFLSHQAYTRPESMLMVPGVLGIVLFPLLFAIFGIIQAFIIIPLSKILSRFTTSYFVGALFGFILAVTFFQLPNLIPTIRDQLTHHRPGILNIHELALLAIPVFFMACCSCYVIFKRRKKDVETYTISEKRKILLRAVSLFITFYVVLTLVFMSHWNKEPLKINMAKLREMLMDGNTEPPVCGDLTVSTLITLVETLLEKPGGYIGGKKLPSGVILTDMHHWELGALTQVHDLVESMCGESGEKGKDGNNYIDPDLSIAKDCFEMDEVNWSRHSKKRRLKKGVLALVNYRDRLRMREASIHPGYVKIWLKTLETRSSKLHQKVSLVPLHISSIDRNKDLLPMNTLRNSGDFLMIAPLSDLNNALYEAYGTIWALSAITQAIEHDSEMLFAGMDATEKMLEIVGLLESVQTKWSPIIITPYGMDAMGNNVAEMENRIMQLWDTTGEINSLFRSHGHAVRLSDFTRCRE